MRFHSCLCISLSNEQRIYGFAACILAGLVCMFLVRKIIVAFLIVELIDTFVPESHWREKSSLSDLIYVRDCGIYFCLLLFAVTDRFF